VTVLGHVQRRLDAQLARPADRLAFGAHAVDLIAEGKVRPHGAWSDRRVIDVSLQEAIAGVPGRQARRPAGQDRKGAGDLPGGLRRGWSAPVRLRTPPRLLKRSNLVIGDPLPGRRDRFRDARRRLTAFWAAETSLSSWAVILSSSAR